MTTLLVVVFAFLVLRSAWKAHRQGPAGFASLDQAAGRFHGWRLRRHDDGPGTF